MHDVAQLIDLAVEARADSAAVLHVGGRVIHKGGLDVLQDILEQVDLVSQLRQQRRTAGRSLDLDLGQHGAGIPQRLDLAPELKELENKILGANERLLVLEHQLFADLLSSISAEVVRIQRTASAVAQLDVLAGFAEAALQNNYVMPNVDESGVMEIKEGRHPVIEQMLKGSLFVPNDTMLDEDENRMLLITGPNMAGKSTYMRQNALIALMAQIAALCLPPRRISAWWMPSSPASARRMTSPPGSRPSWSR